MGRDYYVRFVCPHCFRSKWVIRRDLALTLAEVLNTFWEFQCPSHGSLREKPLEASEKKRDTLRQTAGKADSSLQEE